MRKLFLLLIILLCLPLATAYYADVVMDVSPTGAVTITGVTDYPTLLVDASQNYTFKDASHWLLNITKEGLFEQGLVEIRLPEDAEVNYLKAPSLSRFTHKNGQLVIVSTLENQPFSFLVQYSIHSKKQYPFLLMLIVLIVLGVVTSGLWYFHREKKLSTSFDISVLSARQRAIITLILKNKGRITQAQLEKQLNLPKSSLSRNVEALVRQGLIEKISTGMTNVLKLKK